MSYLDEIDFIKNHSTLLGIEKRNNNIIREWYEFNSNDGKLIFKLSKNSSNNLYLDFAEYQFKSEDALVYPIGFTWSNPKQLKEQFFGISVFYVPGWGTAWWDIPVLPLPFCRIPAGSGDSAAPPVPQSLYSAGT